MACKKPACGCSPQTRPEMGLVIKNSAGEDLLDSKTAGYFPQDKIRLFKKEANGTETNLYFHVRQPMDFGTDKFEYYSLYSTFYSLIPSGQGTFYLKLGDAPAYELKVQADMTKLSITKLLINDVEATKENGILASRGFDMFYFTK